MNRGGRREVIFEDDQDRKGDQAMPSHSLMV